MHTELIAQLLATTAELIRADQADGYKFPRGTMSDVRDTLTANEDGEGKNGRVKYQDGTLAAVLESVADNLG